jgi:hypothetical protein
MLNVLIAIALGVSVFAAGLWAVRTLARPVPSEPDPDQVIEVAGDYRCTVCGLRLTVTHAQDDAGVTAPRHCREPMVET